MIKSKSPLFRAIGRRLSNDVVQAVSTPTPVSVAREPLSDLLGRRHNYLRISLTERCNLRCQYCMPAEGVPLTGRPFLLAPEEMLRLARVFATLGVDKIRLTGGEPTLRADLPQLIQGLCEIEGIRSVSMTTNGLVLTRLLPALQRAGLAAINISLDSLQEDKYERMSRRKGLKRVLAGIDLALQLGYTPVKINTVLMKGFNEDELCDFVEFTRDRQVEVRFIEFMPFSGNKWEDSKLVPYRAALRVITDKYPDLMPCLPRPNDTARVWQVPGYVGKVGFIASMTQHFCSTCNRLRLTADGNLKVCLLGAAEVSLRDAIRKGASDDDLEAYIRTALNNKKPQHAERRSTRGREKKRARRTGYTLSVRQYSTSNRDGTFSHLDAKGKARMVDVSEKKITARTAIAECSLVVTPRLLQLLKDARLPKGDALTVAQIAGALGAKRTSDLIPMCHPIALDLVHVNVILPPGDKGDIRIKCEARVTAKTGAEMEALTGAAVAALTLYDMCKSVDKGMRINNLRVVSKKGGKSDYPPLEDTPRVREHDTSPIKPDETFAPTNFIYF